MAYNPNKELKLYYSIGEVAKMFDVNESLLRYWEKEFPFISPKKAGGNIRQYRKEDIENIRLVYHLVKEKGMTLQGARQKLKMNRETTVRTTEILDRLKLIREELVSMRKELDYLKKILPKSGRAAHPHHQADSPASHGKGHGRPLRHPSPA